MIPIATTIEQGHRLLKVGVSGGSADMCRISKGKKEYSIEVNKWYILGGIPAWSLSKLWQMVYELDKTYEFPTELSAEELIEALVKTLEYRYTHT